MSQTAYPDSEILLAQPRGFCAGVDRAIAVVERALALFSAPIYVRHEIVHNTYVVNQLSSKGAVFVDSLEQVPTGSTVIFSAHGISKAVRAQAKSRGLRVFDATCPLVTKVHMEVAKMRADGYQIVMIGHQAHPEVEGTMGQVQDGIYLVEKVEDVTKLCIVNKEGNGHGEKEKTEGHGYGYGYGADKNKDFVEDKIAYVTQTTLSVDDTQQIIAALKKRFPAIREPKKPDICYATQNRQEAVKLMAPQCELVIVVGSPNSSNSNRLREVAEKSGVPAYMVDAPEQIDPNWLIRSRKGRIRIGVTAGASAPEALVQSVIQRLRELGITSTRTLSGVKEHISFPLPRALVIQPLPGQPVTHSPACAA